MSAILASSLALALILAAAACVLTASTARSLVVSCLALWAAAALGAGALLTLGRNDAALAMALIGAALTPVLLLATLLLSARAAKATKRGRPWLTIIGAVAIVAGVVWGLPDLSEPPPQSTHDGAALFFAGPLFLVAIAAAVGLLGFGERGALEKFADAADE